MIGRLRGYFNTFGTAGKAIIAVSALVVAGFLVMAFRR